jgi:UrcA family protein
MNPIDNRGARRSSAAALGSVIVASLAALPAAAAVNDNPLSTKVTFGDLDISHPPGAAVLYSRIRSAAAKVCTPFGATGIATKALVDECIRQAISGAVTTIDQPALSRISSAKNGRPLASHLISLRNSEVAR